MLTFVLASLLAAPPAGEPWTMITLRPAIVVDTEDAEPGQETRETPEPQVAQVRDAPRLAPAKTQAPKAKVRKARTTQASRKGR